MNEGLVQKDTKITSFIDRVIDVTGQVSKLLYHITIKTRIQHRPMSSDARIMRHQTITMLALDDMGRYQDLSSFTIEHRGIAVNPFDSSLERVTDGSRYWQKG